MASSSIFDIYQYLKYENDKQQPLFDQVFAVRCNVGFVFSNKYCATEKHPWGGKSDIISKIRNDVNIPNGNNSYMILCIMKFLLLAKADGFKFGPDMKSLSKTGRKSIIDMNYQEAQIIADVV